MKHDAAAIHAEKRADILERMAISRSQLLATRAPQSSLPRLPRSPGRAVEIAGALRDAPRVSMLLAMCVGALVFGPRRMLMMAARSAAAALIAKTVRSAVSA
jgi:hypothetical protein